MDEFGADGPYYDDLAPGHVFESPPAVTIDSGLAAAYEAIAGEALALTLDRRLAEAVTGERRRLVSPGLVMHLSIGASTVATKRVIANLFYRDVNIRRQVFEGQTLRTTTRVLAMADATPRPGQAPRGKVLLGIATLADDEPVVEYTRCPLLRLRADTLPGHRDDLWTGQTALDLASYEQFVPAGWNMDLLGQSSEWTVGDTLNDPLRDVVDGALALVRLTHNRAGVHRDVDASPYAQRLVYGGHTVALAQASLGRMLPGLATVVGWQGCDHVGPVFEGDLLSFSHTLLEQRELAGGWLRAVEIQATAHRDDGSPEVLKWTPIVYTT